MKIMYFDVETTGRDPKVNDIIQLSGMIEIDNEIKEEFNIFMQPLDYSTVEQGALDTHGITIEQMKEYQLPNKAYKQFISILEKHIDKFDREDKMYFAGYNVGFDIDFLYQFFQKNNDKYMGSWFNWKKLDPLPLLHFLDSLGLICLENYKLETVAKHYKIKLKAHDAMSDILATKELLKKIEEIFYATR